MNRLLLLFAILFFTAPSNAQVYKVTHIFENKITETYLSDLVNVDDTTNISEFILWGYQRYTDDLSIGTYEVSYFKGSLTETHQFLQKLASFTNKYKDEDNMLAFIDGVKVRIIYKKLFKYILIFDKEQKVPSVFRAKQVQELVDKFEAYCKKNSYNL